MTPYFGIRSGNLAAIDADRVGGRAELASGRCALMLALDDLFVDPMTTIMPAPYAAIHKAPSNRASRHDHRPNMPGFRPGWL